MIKKSSIRYLSMYLVLAVCICMIPLGLGTGTAEAYGSNMSGQWKMVANHNYHFILKIDQHGDRITGTMRRTNGSEPVDRITGRVHENGTIEFTRHRDGSFRQHYRGHFSRQRGELNLEGTFSHNGAGRYTWSARQESRDKDIEESVHVDGQWRMVANHDYRFILKLDQHGDRITGTMRRTNGSEPVDRITGRVHENGTIEFTRYRQGSFKQHYQGNFSRQHGELKLEGTFSHNGVGQYIWSARMSKNNF